MTAQDIRLIGIPGIPLIETGDDLAALIGDAIAAAGHSLQTGDVVVITSKIVSKAEGRWVDVSTVEPNDEARRVAAAVDKDPRDVMLVLQEARRISRMGNNVLITQHKLGFVSANSGIDHSNTRPGVDWRLLLPVDPDGAAYSLRVAFKERFGATVGVVVSDSHGRPFRLGTVGTAIGAAGIPTLWDLRGQPDLFGTKLHATDVGFADEIAAAAGLVLGQAAEGVPVVILQGLEYPIQEEGRATDLIRPEKLDLYR